MILKLWFLLFLASSVRTLENGLSRTPPMGWMHWQRFRCVVDCDTYPDECVSEQLFRKMADLMVKDGYLDAGYEYIIVDDCWMSRERDENGRLQADPERFPSGMKALGDYVHSKGLKFGIYEDYGNFTCGGYPGSLYHLEIDAKTFADWGVDYVKLDGCYSDVDTMEDGYAEFGGYLNDTGRPMVFSCSWPAYQEPNGQHSNYEHLVRTCNLWRNWDDIDDTYASMTGIVNWFVANQDRIAKYSGPGHWNDPDMLIIGNYGLSVEQSKTQMTIWAAMAAPLIMSNDLRQMRPEFKEILLNRDAIAINQDSLGVQGLLILTKNKVHVWKKPIQPIIKDEFSYAIGLVSNRTDGFAYLAKFELEEIGLEAPNGYTVQNIFEKDQPEYVVLKNGSLSQRIPPTGSVLLKLIPI